MIRACQYKTKYLKQRILNPTAVIVLYEMTMCLPTNHRIFFFTSALLFVGNGNAFYLL